MTLMLTSGAFGQSQQPSPPTWQFEPTIGLGDYSATGVRGVYLVIVDQTSGQRAIFNVGTFYEDSCEQESFVAWDHQANPLDSSHPNATTSDFALSGTSHGAVSGEIVAASGLTYATADYSFDFARTHFYSQTEGNMSVLVVANETSDALASSWFSNALSNEALPNSLYNVVNTQTMCGIIEGIGLGIAIVGGITNAFACQSDALQAADFGRQGCSIAYGPAADEYCEQCYQTCKDCVSELFTDDNFNCITTAGINTQDDDYDNCATGCVCP